MKVLIAIAVMILLVFLLNYFFPYFLTAFRLTILRGHLTATPYDLADFKNREISSGNDMRWPEAENYNRLLMSEEFKRQHEEMKTSAFLIARNGELIHEQYFDIHERNTLSNSFSMAKTIVTLMAGKAIEEGYIGNMDQKVADFFPEYAYPPADQLTLRDLMQMSSGMDWNENYYLPLNETTDAYYGDRLPELILSRKIIDAPGRSFNYQSGNTQLLGMILDKVLPTNLSNYLSDKFWKPMGMEHTAYWTIDESTGLEKTYCCIHATARDFLKFGQLFLQDGQWNHTTLISKKFMDEMRSVGFSSTPQYGAGLWLDDSYDPPFYLMRGHLGQYVIVLPSENMTICRLGEKYMKDDDPPRLQLEDIYMYVDGAMAMDN